MSGCVDCHSSCQHPPTHPLTTHSLLILGKCESCRLQHLKWGGGGWGGDRNQTPVTSVPIAKHTPPTQFSARQCAQWAPWGTQTLFPEITCKNFHPLQALQDTHSARKRNSCCCTSLKDFFLCHNFGSWVVGDWGRTRVPGIQLQASRLCFVVVAASLLSPHT